MTLVTQFHPLLVTLHWLLSILIVVMLGAGFFLLASMPNSDPHKVGVLLVHMSVGMVIFVLMAVRLLVRLRTARPADATAVPLLQRIARAVHYIFYAVVFLMIVTGYATAIFAGLNRIVFQGSGEPLPPDFSSYPTFVGHGYLALLLAGLIVLHVAAVLYHQSVAKDPLLQRMWCGRRFAEAAGAVGLASRSSSRPVAIDLASIWRVCWDGDESPIPGSRMSRQVDYYFSLQSLWAYIGHKLFREVVQTYELKVNHKPVVLVDLFSETGGLPLMKRHPVRQRYRMVELQRWRDKRGLRFHLQPANWPFNARLADGLVIAALEAGHDPDPFLCRHLPACGRTSSIWRIPRC